MLTSDRSIEDDLELLLEHGAPYGTGWEHIPVIKNIHQAVYNWVLRNPDNFNMELWRAESDCGTTYCRAGLVVMLAGDPFPELWGYGEANAGGIANLARLIYRKSDPSLDWQESQINFFGSDEEALENMAELAQYEASLAQGK